MPLNQHLHRRDRSPLAQSAVVLLSAPFVAMSLNPELEIWIAFQVGRHLLQFRLLARLYGRTVKVKVDRAVGKRRTILVSVESGWIGRT